MAMKAESQLHWWGYSVGEARVHVPMSFSRSTAAARAVMSSGRKQTPSGLGLVTALGSYLSASVHE